LSPDKFAKISVAISKWLRNKDGDGAYLIWERNGPGVPYGNKVVELGYSNIYFQESETSVTRKSTDTPGWWSDNDSNSVCSVNTFPRSATAISQSAAKTLWTNASSTSA